MQPLASVKTRLGFSVTIAVLAFCGLLFLGMAAYNALALVLPEVWAALIVAGTGFLLAALVMVVRLLWLRRSQASAPDPGDQVEAALQAQTDPLVSDYVRRYPDRALLASLAVGVAAGCSPRVRQTLKRTLDAYLEDENQARRQ